jgi:predicted nuclease with RNAse H fold
MQNLFAGIDVGQRSLHVVLLGTRGELVGQLHFAATEPDRVVESLVATTAIAIDSPDRLSTAPHAAESGLALPPKFRMGRCAEIGLLKLHRYQVPWVTPVSDEPPPPWMRVGIDLFARLREAGMDPIEVFPDAAFRRLAGQLKALPKKGTPAGSAERARLLALAGVSAPGIEMWGNDWIDAALAAQLARMSVSGDAIAATCGHDGSAIWIPAQPATE